MATTTGGDTLTRVAGEVPISDDIRNGLYVAGGGHPLRVFDVVRHAGDDASFEVSEYAVHDRPFGLDANLDLVAGIGFGADASYTTLERIAQ